MRSICFVVFLGKFFRREDLKRWFFCGVIFLCCVAGNDVVFGIRLRRRVANQLRVVEMRITGGGRTLTTIISTVLHKEKQKFREAANEKKKQIHTRYNATYLRIFDVAGAAKRGLIRLCTNNEQRARKKTTKKANESNDR